MAKPATAPHGEPASDFEHLAGPLANPDTSYHPVLQLRCELVGTDEVIGAGLAAHGAFDMCRQLVANGVDPNVALECYRSGRFAFRVKSIGAGAKLTVRETAAEGPRVVSWKAFPHRAVTAPVRSNQEPVYPAAPGERALRLKA
jgi:hypothetical protein